MAGNVRTRAGRLPADVTSFVGRHQEIGELRRLLASARLVTLTGVGGTGKSRLALRLAADLRRSFDDGVWQVDLSTVGQRSLVDYAVAAALDVQNQTGRGLTDAIADYLRDRQLLLVLDNCAHVLDACAHLVDHLLRAAPRLRVVCTSRQPLGTAGERIWTVPPLPVPRPDEALLPDAVGRHAALALFAERGAAASNGFAVTAGNLALVTQVCRSLDGLPLAIELAAAQLRTLTLEQLAAGLADRFRLLSARHATPIHHRSLQSTFEWSFELCTPPEQAMWMRVSVFADSFTVPAAEFVCGDQGEIDEDGGDDDGHAVADALTGLVDKSVLIREDAPDGTRYRLLATVRQFGLERLRGHDADAESQLRRRHRAYYAGLAERYETDWFSPAQLATYHAVQREHANLRAALQHCLDTADTHAALDLAGTLWFYWNCCGHVAEGRHWVDQALALDRPHAPDRAGLSDQKPDEARTMALWSAAGGAVAQGESEEATRLIRQCQAEAARSANALMLAHALHVEATIAQFDDDLPRAEELFAETLRRFDELGEVNSNVLMARAQLAFALAARGEFDRADALSAEVEAAGARHGERWALAWAKHVRAVAALARGEVPAATAHARECLRLHRDFHNLTGIAMLVELLAQLALATGSGRRAGVLHGVAQQVWLALGRRLFGSKDLNAQRDECERQARAAIGDTAYEAAYGQGCGLALDDAMAYALGEDGAPRDGSDGGPDPAAKLTPREREVADLIADGLSNKQIAARLVTSQRTAETHVENILRKLGYTSRGQVAASVLRQRGTGRP